MKRILKFSQLKKDNYYFYKAKKDGEILIFLIVKIFHNHLSIRDKILLRGIKNNWSLVSDNVEDSFDEEGFEDYLSEWNVFELNSKEVEEYKQEILLLKL